MKQNFSEVVMFYVGPLEPSGTCAQRMRAFQSMRIRLHLFDIQPTRINIALPYVCEAIYSRTAAFFARAGLNSRLLRAALRATPDVIWIDKGINIKPQTLIALRIYFPRVKIVSYSPDDMFNPKVTTSLYVRSIPIYDLHVTTKSFNVDELRAAGARDVFFVDNAYDPFTHYPTSMPVNERAKLGGDVGFIGSFEVEREKYIVSLAESGIPVRIWGRWPRKPGYPSSLRVEGKELVGGDYARAINSFSVNLCFLRKANRDRQTTRSVEIPACGGFMLAERTEEHQRLFAEKREAAYFETIPELHAAVTYYLAHDDERKKIADAGHERCINGEYSNQARLASVLNYLLR